MAAERIGHPSNPSAKTQPGKQRRKKRRPAASFLCLSAACPQFHLIQHPADARSAVCSAKENVLQLPVPGRGHPRLHGHHPPCCIIGHIGRIWTHRSQSSVSFLFSCRPRHPPLSAFWPPHPPPCLDLHPVSSAIDADWPSYRIPIETRPACRHVLHYLPTWRSGLLAEVHCVLDAVLTGV
jgi:hypothetical protein